VKPPLGLRLYSAASALAAPAVPALLRARARRGKEDLARLGERLGQPGRPRPAGELVWLHAASVGEGLSLLPLIEALSRRRPGTGILATTGTTAAAALLDRRLPPGAIHQYAPLDGPAQTQRFLEAWRPALGVFVESEIWPNLILAARTKGVPLALLSARLSEASLRGWRRVPASARRLFGAFGLVMAQDIDTAARLKALGARDDGLLNLKRHMAAPPVDEALVREVSSRAEGRALFLAASTHEGEESLVLEAFRTSGAEGALVIAPRHPDRGDRVEALVRRAGYEVRRRSRREPFEPGAVYLADTLGELGSWFALASGSLIGGSLIEGPGGHNPLEAAQLGSPILAGPHVSNWREIYASLYAADAATAVAAETLKDAIRAALERAPELAVRAERARAAAAAGQGRLEHALDLLLGLIG
jgi:3-deoxy-D-manno-octulosonic-acid transferase